jgi:RNA polymerase sigma-70 factor (ECF subfamily)
LVTELSLSSSLAELFASHHARIRRYILSIVHDPDEADDLTQDVFLQAHRRLGSLRDPDAVTSWLYRIATHVCYDRFRQWSRRPRAHSLDPTEPAGARPVAGGEDEPALGRVIEQAEMSGCVRSYLQQLPDDYRTPILLHDLEGATNAEIAEMLGISLDLVKIRLHRARRKLEAALVAHCDFSRDEQGVFVCEPATQPLPTPGARPPSRSKVYPS